MSRSEPCSPFADEPRLRLAEGEEAAIELAGRFLGFETRFAAERICFASFSLEKMLSSVG